MDRVNIFKNKRKHNNNNNDNNNNNNNNNDNNKSMRNRICKWQMMRDTQSLGSRVKTHPNNEMKTRSKNTYSIVHREGKQGTLCLRESNQPRVEKCTTESAHSYVDQAQSNLLIGPSRVTPTTEKEEDERQK